MKIIRDYERIARVIVRELRGTFFGSAGGRSMYMREAPENHMHAVSFYFMVYNFVKIHSSIKTTPALQAGVTDFLWSMEGIVLMADTNG